MIEGTAPDKGVAIPCVKREGATETKRKTDTESKRASEGTRREWPWLRSRLRAHVCARRLHAFKFSCDVLKKDTASAANMEEWFLPRLRRVVTLDHGTPDTRMQEGRVTSHVPADCVSGFFTVRDLFRPCLGRRDARSRRSLFHKKLRDPHCKLGY